MLPFSVQHKWQKILDYKDVVECGPLFLSGLLSQLSSLVPCAASYTDHTSFSMAQEKTHSEILEAYQAAGVRQWMNPRQVRTKQKHNTSDWIMLFIRDNHSHGLQRLSDGVLVDEI